MPSSCFVKFRSQNESVKRPNALMTSSPPFCTFLALSSQVPKCSEYEKEVENESVLKGFCQSSSAKARKRFILSSLLLLTIASMVMVNGDEADAVLQSVLLWTCARLFDWVITLFRDALACDEQDESNHYHSSLV